MCEKLIRRVMKISFYSYADYPAPLLRSCGLSVRRSKTIKDDVVYLYCMKRFYEGINVSFGMRNIIYYNGHFHYAGIFLPMFFTCDLETKCHYTMDHVDIAKFHEEEKGIILKITEKE